MKYSNTLLLWFSIFVIAASFGLAADMEITHQARSLQPGEVLKVEVTVPKPLTDLHASVFEKRFQFYSTDVATNWNGLVGIDLDVKPGKYTLEIVGIDENGSQVKGTYPLSVVSKQFPVRRLTVDPKFVSPPQAELARIQRESALVAGIFKRANPVKLWEGPFLRPVPGEANSSFGKRSILNGQPKSPHSGTDFTAAAGTPIKAPNNGSVILATDLYYSGNTVILDHGLGLYSYFAHLSRIDVAEKDKVKAGQIVGLVGSTGRVTGPHLHWTVRLSEARIDPMGLLAILASD